ncbi:MAG: hypothetical protein IPG66_16145 [Hydrogenophilales bacterium]|nr:hypothetical protein [Hydrogenophilales bacterium]
MGGHKWGSLGGRRGNKGGDKISIIGHRVDGGLGAMINSQLAFNEFWNMVGWEYVFTVYSKLTPNNFWHARKMLPDPQIDLPQSMRYLQFENDLELSRKLSEPIDEGRWRSLVKSWKDAIPDDFKRNTMIVLCEKSPAHRHLLPKELQDERRNKQLNAVKKLRDLGYSAEYLCDDFLRDDYTDIVHLSIQGAEKLASRLVGPIKAVEFMMMEH